ncbi:DNA glycosylase AlkZ-like family protein [Nesterenkonia suensis]
MSVSQAWVRRAVVAAQRIPSADAAADADAADVLRDIGLIQLDPLMRVSTAQRLTCLTRLPRTYRAEDVDGSLWPPGRVASFESFTKVACVFPIEDWPLLRLRREHQALGHRREMPAAMVEQIRQVVSEAGCGVQIGAIESQVGDGERTTGWNWTQVKQVAELMVRTGELVITARDGTTRLFDLPERALPAEVRQAADLPDDELRAALARRAAANLAVMTRADFAHHYHLTAEDATAGIALAGLVPLEVEGWGARHQAFCLPELLDGVLPDPTAQGVVAAPAAHSAPATHAAPAAHAPAVDVGRHRGQDVVRAGEDTSSVSGARQQWGDPREARLIGPFDPLLRDRGRARRVFGFDYLFEAYVPRAKRVYGHYVMGVLSGGRMIGRVDIQRVGAELRINGAFPEPGVPRRVLLPRVRGAGKTLARQLGTQLVMPD